MCSFSASPVPTPSQNRPGSMAAVVAAAWPTIAGWMRVVGHVTPVPIDIRSVVCAMAPRTDQAKAEFPCRSVQG